MSADKVKRISYDGGNFWTVTYTDGSVQTVYARKEQKMAVRETLLKDKGTGDTSKSKLTAIVFGLWNVACTVFPDVLSPFHEVVNGVLGGLFGIFIRDAVRK